MILSKQGLQRSFNTEWTNKWVPSVVLYCKRLKRKDIKLILKDMEEGRVLLVNKTLLSCMYPENDDQRGALKLLYHLLCIQPKKGDSENNNISYLFSQYEVN